MLVNYLQRTSHDRYFDKDHLVPIKSLFQQEVINQFLFVLIHPSLKLLHFDKSHKVQD